MGPGGQCFWRGDDGRHLTQSPKVLADYFSSPGSQSPSSVLSWKKPNRELTAARPAVHKVTQSKIQKVGLELKSHSLITSRALRLPQWQLTQVTHYLGDQCHEQGPVSSVILMLIIVLISGDMRCATATAHARASVPAFLSPPPPPLHPN